jgi:folate-binding protein YgfZ
LSAGGATGALGTEALDALRPGGPGAVVAAACDLVWVEGPDAERFLQGTLTNDVAALTAGEACEALLLDAKGRVRHGAVAHRDGDAAFTLVTASGRGGALADDLEALHVSEDLEVFWDAGELAITNAPGALAADLEIPVRPNGLRGFVGVTGDAAAAALGVPLVPGEALAALRVEAGEPDASIDAAGRLVQEVALERVAVSFSKGCYLGQETVARAAHRGGVRRRLAGLRLSATVPAGTTLTHEGREVGRTGTCANHPSLGPVALAVVRAELPEGAELGVAGRPEPAVLSALPMT